MPVIGIDLGTTNSACSVFIDSEARLVPNGLGEVLTPSVVSLEGKDNILVGQAAKDRLITHPKDSAELFKRVIGTQKEFLLGKQKYSAVELSSMLLKSLKADAEVLLEQPVTEAVISVPAYFNDVQRRATKMAAEIAGLNVERLINEPTAAALAYGLNDKPEEQNYMILDLGGGTFDVTILEYFDGVMEVHASAGDNQLGGEDFVTAIVKDMAGSIDTPQQDWRPEETAKLYRQAEYIKRELSTESQAEASISLGEQTLEYRLTEEKFEQLTQPLLQRLFSPIERALMDSKLQPDEIDEVVLVGGATRMPIMRKLVARLLKRFPACHINPDEVVALGAGIQAGLLAQDAALDEVVLTDVSPYSLGMATHNESEPDNMYFSPLIERNSVLPTSFTSDFYNVHDKQTRLDIQVFQGESRYVKNNIYIGNLEVEIPQSKAHEARVDVRFSYDNNGLLEVDATVAATGRTFNKVFEQRPGSMKDSDKAEALKKLAKLKIHPRDEVQNKTLQTTLDRLYEQLKGGNREYVGSLISQFEHVLASQDKQEIKRTYKRIQDELKQAGFSAWMK